MVNRDILHPIWFSLEKSTVYLCSSGSSEFPYTPLLLLPQRLARGAADVPGPWEEVIWSREATHAVAVHAAEASVQEDVAAWECAAALVKEAEDRPP
jgi:hypothetical protein